VGLPTGSTDPSPTQEVYIKQKCDKLSNYGVSGLCPSYTIPKIKKKKKDLEMNVSFPHQRAARHQD
jgi:hypothetical protein